MVFFKGFFVFLQHRLNIPHAGVIFSLHKSYIEACRLQLYYIRLQSCPQGNITWRKPNITAKQYNSPKANIAENTVIVVSQLRCFHGGRYRTRTYDLPHVKLYHHILREVSTAGGNNPSRIPETAFCIVFISG